MFEEYGNVGKLIPHVDMKCNFLINKCYFK